MNRHIPVELLNILVSWFGSCYTCVRWHGISSNYFKINRVRQGGVLSPFLFALYLDDVVKNVCKRSGSVLSIILYADDILILSPSVYYLQQLLTACKEELLWLDMLINSKKSCCMRIGPRFNKQCKPIVTLSGDSLPWVDEIRYLSIYFVSARHFKCSLDKSKRAFYWASNAIFGKTGRIASEEIILELLNRNAYQCSYICWKLAI